MNSVKIGTYQMDTAFGLYLPEYTIPAPAPQTKFVKIIGRDGSVDLSDAIGLHYDSRSWSLDFKCFDPTVNWHTLTSSVMNAIHGKRLNFEFDDDPDYFWTGRISVSSYVSTRGTGTLKVNITSDPFKYAKLSTIVTKTASTGTEYTGSMVTFNNGLIYDLSADIEPTQDLHGYANPWPAGGGGNILPMPITSGSYANSVTVAVNPDLSFVINKPSSSGWTMFQLGSFLLAAGTYTLIEADDGNQNASISILREDSTEITNTRYVKRRVFTLTSSETVKATYSRAAAATDVLTKIMLFAGDTKTADDYAPYSNICPISGLTGLSVYRTGKNLVGITLSQHNANNLKTNVFSLPKGTFAISVGSSITLGGMYLRIGSTLSAPTIAQIYNSNTLMVTLTEAYSELILQLYKGDGVLVSDIEYVQIEADSATAYEPYNGNTYSVDWSTQAGTVYGGTVDVVTGVLTVDRRYTTIGNESVSAVSGSQYSSFEITPTAGNKSLSKNSEVLCISSAFKGESFNSASASADNYVFCSGGNIRIKNTANASLSASDWKTLMSDVQLCYKLATPLTYQLTPQEIQALVGTNNIWTSSGNVSVTVVTPETVTNNGLPIVPTVTASADMVLRWGNYSASVQQGTSTIPQLVLDTGDNHIYIIGTGSISFEWSEASL